MKKLIATVLTVAAALCTPAVSGSEGRVPGESLDSGLGALPAAYTGKEFMNLSPSHVAGEKQDSCLSNVSKEEQRRIDTAYEAATQRQREKGSKARPRKRPGVQGGLGPASQEDRAFFLS